ncbi:hypothetical protein N0V93_004399 [Gnomoniopsis smithogilvyi]|uniref:Probable guanine deaminase n=1 Tax=Gnomoniopsis smithogilvyi TaxID=1191159 RepID=A0A9W9CX60_9PEZI|nr:hypothetical protein N0V93_004399 [Gnomoniopsis smithogilvyi]
MSAATPPASPKQVYIGTFIHPTAPNELAYLHDTAVFVDGTTGRIVAIEPATARNEVLQRLGWRVEEIQISDISTGTTEPGGKRFFFPGLIDTHIHASQYPNVGIFGKSTLLDWLDKYTFPLEASLGKDLAKARRVYSRVVRKTLSHGTTAAAYFATTDVEATKVLADICLSAGQRALVGRVCMDEARICPAWYRDESAVDSIEKTRAVVDYLRDRDPRGDLVRPIVTPRFAPSCTPAAMRELGEMARAEGLAVQTHVSENKGECDLVAEMFPEETKDGKGYVGVYDAFGLLGERTILAHAIHLSEQEVKTVADTRSGVSHCPCSNTAITSGAARVRWLLDRGVDVGLGTDVSGGYSPSVLEAARQASLVSRHVAMGLEGDEKERAKLSVEEVLWLATRGGAKLVGLEGRVGGFEVGMEWDALLVDLGGVGEEGEDVGEDGNVDVFGWESWEECVAKWLFNGDDRNLRKVWVRGRLVHERV